MTDGEYSEYSIVERPTMRLLAELGWDTLSGFNEHPGDGNPVGRSNFVDVILEERLRWSIRHLNPQAPDALVDDAVEALARDRSAMLATHANQQVWALLRDGFRGSYVDGAGRTHDEVIRYVNWNNTDENDFLAVNQFWVSGPLYRRRADIVLFVNGVPLVLIELKASHERIEDAYRRNICDYRDAVPHLFTPNGFVVVSNGSDAKLGATFATWEHFGDWKRVDREDEQGRVALETLVRATCAPARVLDLVENFTAFQQEPGGLVKKVAKNHQYLGVNNAIEALQRIDRDPRKLGVFWHTQGSGKSLSMIFFTQKVLRKVPGGWTFVMVTDRRDLDDQLYGEFDAAGVIQEGHVQATSADHLRQLLAEDHRYVFTLIHKFRPPGKPPDKQPMDVLSDRRNVVVITDEAHRTQYKTLAHNMRNALPNASFLGFTGTPLMGGEIGRTREEFGEYVSIYSWSDAQTDSVAVPLHYENRIPELQIINDDFAEEFAELLDAEVADDADDETESYLARRFAREYQLLTRTDRLRRIAHDLVRHFVGRGFDGKAMYVAVDKATALKMYNFVKKEWKSYQEELEQRLATATAADRAWLEGRLAFMRTTDMAVVVSPSQNEVAHLARQGLDIRPHRERMNRQHLDKKFKDPADPFRLVFVCAMWMTGFDVPSCSTVYLDRPMRNHTLMQTIARANRVFPEKENGLIVDYVGVFRRLEQALAVYGTRPSDAAAQERPVEPKAKLVEELAQTVEECADLCDRCDVDIDFLADEKDDFAFIRLRDLAVEQLLIDPAQTREYLALADRCRSLLKAVLPDPAANPFVKRVGVVRNLAEKIRGERTVPDLSGLAEAVDELLDRSVGAEPYLIRAAGGDELSPYIDLSQINFDKLREIYGTRQHTAADRLAKLLRQRTARSATRNPTRVTFVQRIEELIAEYNAGSLNIDEYLRRLVQLTRELDEDERRIVAEGLTEQELAVFDILTRPGPDLTAAERETVKGIARELLDAVTDKLVLDWRKRQRSLSAVRVAVGQALNDLPEAYDDDLFEEKRNLVFDHILSVFGDDGDSI